MREPRHADVTSTGTVVLMDAVTKRYGRDRVLNGLSLQVRAGEVFGFLGRNGAGKSTAIRILMGITRPGGGHIELFGQPCAGATVGLRQRIGYVAQEQHFYPWMTPRSLAGFVAGMYPHWDSALFELLMRRFDLPANRKIASFSGGMKAKLALSVALSPRPPLLLLDEPTAGMDPVARREFLDLVNEHALNEGAAVFFSTHLIDEIENAAHRVAIIEAGRTIYEGSLAALGNSVACFSILPDADPGTTVNSPFAGEYSLPGTVQVLQQRRHHGGMEVVMRFPDGIPADILLAPGWQRQPISLEDVFIAMVSAAAFR